MVKKKRKKIKWMCWNEKKSKENAHKSLWKKIEIKMIRLVWHTLLFVWGKGCWYWRFWEWIWLNWFHTHTTRIKREIRLTVELKLELCQYLKFSLIYIIYTIFEAILMFYLNFFVLFIFKKWCLLVLSLKSSRDYNSSTRAA